MAADGLDASTVSITTQDFSMNALLDHDVDAAQAMTYNEWAQILEVVNPDTGELYQPEDFDVVSYEDTDGAMLQDAIWADTARLDDPAYADAAVRFLKAITKGWIYARDNPEDAAATVYDIASNAEAAFPVGPVHQQWQMNEVNKLIWDGSDFGLDRPGGLGQDGRGRALGRQPGRPAADHRRAGRHRRSRTSTSRRPSTSSRMRASPSTATTRRSTSSSPRAASNRSTPAGRRRSSPAPPPNRKQHHHERVARLRPRPSPRLPLLVGAGVAEPVRHRRRPRRARSGTTTAPTTSTSRASWSTSTSATGHPKVVKAIQDQAALLPTVAPAHANLARGEAAKRILAKAGPAFGKVFFTNGGADANENAIRMARLTTGRDKILTHYRSYHGNTGAAVVATGDWRRVPNEFARGHVHFFGPFLYRSEFWSRRPSRRASAPCTTSSASSRSEGATSIAAILLEGIPGTAGVLVPPPGYLTGVRELCDKYGILLILDEVMSGFGRTGDWFAWQNEVVNPDGVVPDLITFAKGVNSGYVPAGGVIISESIANAFDDQVFPGGLTYSGHPLAMAVDRRVDRRDGRREDRRERAAHRRRRARPGPARARDEAPDDRRGARARRVLGARPGSGCRRRASRSRPRRSGLLKAELMKRGLLPFVADNRIHVVPPCTVTDAEVDEGARDLRRGVHGGRGVCSRDSATPASTPTRPA